jgi:hypothetical protein
MRKLSNQEMLNGDDKFFCDTCKNLQDASKQYNHLLNNKSFDQTSARDSDNPPEEIQVRRESCKNGQAELEDSLSCGNKIITKLQ